MKTSALEAIVKRSPCLFPSFTVPKLRFLSFPRE